MPLNSQLLTLQLLNCFSIPLMRSLQIASAEQEGPVRTVLEYAECTFYVGFYIEYSIHIC